MTRVGVRELKNQLSRYLMRVKNGEVVAITLRGRHIAILAPVATSTMSKSLAEMVSAGLADWKGGKPAGSARPALVRGKPLSDLIIEDRR
jgi:prevent-host-death family protein